MAVLQEGHQHDQPSAWSAVALGIESWQSSQHSLAENSGTPAFTLYRQHDSYLTPGSLEGPGMVTTYPDRGYHVISSQENPALLG